MKAPEFRGENNMIRKLRTNTSFFFRYGRHYNKTISHRGTIKTFYIQIGLDPLYKVKYNV